MGGEQKPAIQIEPSSPPAERLYNTLIRMREKLFPAFTAHPGLYKFEQSRTDCGQEIASLVRQSNLIVRLFLSFPLNSNCCKFSLMTKKFYLFPFQNKPSAIFHQTKVLQHFCTVMCAEVREGQGATVTVAAASAADN